MVRVSTHRHRRNDSHRSLFHAPRWVEAGPPASYQWRFRTGKVLPSAHRENKASSRGIGMSRSFDEAMRKQREAPEEESPSKPCVTCGNDGKEYFRVDGKPTRICFKCWSKTD